MNIYETMKKSVFKNIHASNIGNEGKKWKGEMLIERYIKEN